MILQADARHIPLRDNSVQTVITSPPYWGLRDYGTARWEGGSVECDHVAGMARGDTNRETPGGRGGSFRGGEIQFRDICGKCGARRIDSQIGLEPTPELYVEHIVAVFREVRRVLRDDGTVWCNLGDSYNGSGAGGGGNRKGNEHGQHDALVTAGRPYACGLKPKDLVGVPWRVAFALQQPYYAGRIARVEDRVWLAAIIDGEGCLFIHKRKAGQSNGQGYERQNDSYGAGLEVANTHRAILERCLEITGIGSICTVERETRTKKRNIPLHRWNVRSNQCRNIIREVYPYLIGKQHEARLLLGCPSSGRDAELAHAGLIALHRGYTPAIDFPAPESLYTPGWYLRSDIIWNKKNPMPESVTDRPTKAHEYIFLLSKRERYYYDAEAIKEPLSPSTIEWAGGKNGWGPSNPQHGTPNAIHGPSLRGQGRCGENGSFRNRRSVWTVATQPYSEAHFATFPEDLIKPCILAGTSERGCCSVCGAPVERVTEKTGGTIGHSWHDHKNDLQQGQRTDVPSLKVADYGNGPYQISTLGWRSTCKCDAPTRPCIVFDPFGGSCTTVKVAQDLGRIGIAIDIKPEYLAMGKRRAAQGGLGI